MSKSSEIHNLIKKYAFMSSDELFNEFNTSKNGLSINEAEKRKNNNNFTEFKKSDFLKRILRAFLNPFSIILTVIVIVSLFIDIIYKNQTQSNIFTVFVMCTMIILSGFIRFFQENSSINIYNNILRHMDLNVSVRRNGILIKIPLKDIVVGDIVVLSSGDKVPADIRLISHKNTFVSQSVVTGESGVTEKNSFDIDENYEMPVFALKNIIFAGTTVISGKCEGIVLFTDNNTLYGSMNILNNKRGTKFRKDANSIPMVFIRFMTVLVPLVFIISSAFKHNFLNSFIFALSVVIGLIPEMLPMIITVCLAKGSLFMSKKQTVIKNINAMEGFGSMDILCMDKTGTLTNDNIIMEYYMDILGNEYEKVLDYAYINSVYQSSGGNYIDKAVLKYRDMPKKSLYCCELEKKYRKLDEIPFNSARKYVSVLVSDFECKKIIITKGSVNEVFSKCKYAYYEGELYPVNKNDMSSVNAVVDEMYEDGMKVIAVAIKNVNDIESISENDENDLVLMGYIAFFDAPKKSAKDAIYKLKNINVNTKVLTGDNKDVALSVCSRVGIKNNNILTGNDIDKMTDEEFSKSVENTNIFAELSPSQKVDIIKSLKNNGHTVGFIGDGMNDIPALNEADVAISVDSGVYAVKETADVILMKKDLNVLEEGILEGRKTFANMTKYIRITASSNFGNILAIVCAGIFLPFMPMTSIQLLMLNIFYDIICIALPWDNVDNDMYTSPQDWGGKTLGRFMRFFGPVSSVFDVITFLFLYFVLCPYLCYGKIFTDIVDTTMKLRYITLFQTGWFLESMLTQIIIIHTLRTKNIPFVQSRASKPVTIITSLGMLFFIVVLFTPLGKLFGFTVLPPVYVLFIIIIIGAYMALMNVFKKIYIKKYNSLV